MKNNIIKTGLIGFGTGGQFFHAPFIHTLREFELTAVLERTKELSKVLYPYTKIVKTPEELFDIEEIELIVITTPNDTHFELARKALEAGKNVVIDKPFTVNTLEAKELIKIAKATNKILTVYHNRRFHSDFKTVQVLLSEGSLGELTEYLACFDRFRPELRPTVWKEHERPGAGILYDLGSHLIDQVLLLFGKPLSISAELKIERPGAKVIDCFELIFYYENHKAILRSGMLVEVPGPVFKLTGTKGIYIKNGLDPQEALLRQAIMPDSELWAVEKEDTWGDKITAGESQKVRPVYCDYREFYRNIYGAIRNGETLLVSPEQAELVIYCIELAIRSSVENKAKISL